MSFSIESIQPFIQWLHAHPQLALGITFIIAFAESLAVIGSIIPGSVTMTAVGILAGSGVIRIDLSLLSATLGAITGDGASYLLGYYFSDRLTQIWPFCRYPHWLEYGKNFFIRHGKKSILIGRFAGPLRALIPVIAGMMHMNRLHFYIANIISGFLWSVLYMLPGIMIGAAASELSPESAIRFCLIILGLLVSIWLCGIVLKWLLIQLGLFIRHHLHSFWLTYSRKSRFSKIICAITPQDELLHDITASWVIVLFVCAISFVTLCLFVLYSPDLHTFNFAIYYVFQSFKTISFDRFFVTMNQLGQVGVLGSLVLVVTGSAALSKKWHLLYYWVSLMLWTGIFIILCHMMIENDYPLNIFVKPIHHSFPTISVAFTTSIFLSLYLFIQQQTAPIFKTGYQSLLIAILLLYGMSTLYLDESWLSGVVGGYLLGSFVTISHWIFFRTRLQKKLKSVNLFIYIILFTVVLTFTVSNGLNYKKSLHAHQLHVTQYLLTESQWWDQNETLLPRFQKNRFGRVTSPLNIQYDGELLNLEKTLRLIGWQNQNETFYQSVVKKLTNHPLGYLTPILTPLYLNRKPVLIMRYYQTNPKTIFILRLWRSNYFLVGQDHPIWIGYIHAYPILNKNLKKQRMIATIPSFLTNTLEKSSYQVKTVMPVQNKQVLPEHSPIILIRE